MNHGCIIGESVEIDLMTLDKLEGELIVSDKVFGRGKGKKCFASSIKFCFISSK